ncbi:1345_t:CDS:2, partial [Gigaspora rosea]
MLDLSTRIHKDNLFSKTSRSEILRNQPWNSEIKYKTPTMDKQIWKLMLTQAKDTDKLLAKPNNDTEALQAWEYIKTALKDTRFLLLNSLSYTNDLRKRQKSLKVISPNYTLPKNKDKVFEVAVINPFILEVIPVLAECEGAITGHTIDHKIRKTSFGAATIMEVVQEYTTIKTMHQTKERSNTSGNEFNVSSSSMVTTD